MNLLPALPAPVHRVLAGATPHRITIGQSPATTLRYRHPDAAANADHILKILPVRPGHTLHDEAARLRWLQGRLPVPALISFVTTPHHEFLLTSALPGTDAASTSLPAAQLVPLLADALRQLHTLDARACPFRQAWADDLANAHQRMLAHEVNETDFDPPHLGRSVADLWTDLARHTPIEETLIFTHGDFSLPNIIVDHDRLAGFIDLGRAGLGDPRRDLALAARSIARNLGPTWVEPFFAHYGTPPPPASATAPYLLLDEFF